MNTLFKRVMNRTHNEKPFTIFMVDNWFYGRNQNPVLDEAFEQLMYEVDPSGLEEQKKALAESQLAEV